MKYVLLFLWLTLFINNALFAQEDSLKAEKKIAIIPLPALFYTPETRLGFGALVSGVFNLGDKATTRKSNSQVLAAYTLNKQIIFETSHNLFTSDEAWVLNGELNYYDFPIFYYGIGNDTQKDFEEDLTYEVVDFRERVIRQIRKNFFVGPQYRFSHLYNLVFDPVFLQEDETVLKSQTGITSGLGLAAIYDSRNNVLNASAGLFAQFSTFFHGEVIGSDFQFNRYTVDIRKYWPLNDTDVVAAQFFGEFNSEGVPFREMALMGGDMIMRGYYNGRFRDNQQVALQGEYRKQIISWVGVVAFGALGDVSPNLKSFDLEEFKYTIGGGLRFMVNKADRLNIRIDYGIGKNTSGFYFAFAESF